MRIAKIEDFEADAGWRNFCFLKVTTDDGLTGWSEYNESHWSRGLTAVIRKLAELAIGQDPRAVGRLTSRLYTTTRMTAGGLNQQAIAAIENACLDLKAKALGVPVYSLFGGPFRERIPLYWSHCGSFRARHVDLFEKVIGTPPLRTLDDIKRLGEEVVRRGYKALKTNPIRFDGGMPRMLFPGFSPNPTDLAHNFDADDCAAIQEQLAAFRDGIGPRNGLIIDLNFSLKAEGLIRTARALEPYNLTWLEMDMYEPKALATVRQSTSAPIGSLEALCGRRNYKPYFENYSVDVAIIDAPWNGLLESVKIAAMAEAYEVNIAPHNFCGHLYTMINAHLAAAIPNLRIMELEVDDVPWKDDFVSAPPVVENGELLLPTGPGWGLDVNEEALRAHPVK